MATVNSWILTSTGEAERGEKMLVLVKKEKIYLRNLANMNPVEVKNLLKYKPLL